MRFRATRAAIAALALSLIPTSCTDADIEDGETDAFPDGKADGGIEEGSPEAIGVLALVNATSSTASALKEGAGVTSRVANNIANYRNGADGAAGTADDNKFDTLKELDAIPYVGPAALNALLELARSKGLVTKGAKIEVIFSPQLAEASHNARIAKQIRDAKKSVDIAMYSYSDAGIAAALADAVSRGLKVRFLFDTARDDKGVTDAALRAATKSGKLEAAGVDVRYVNKILHHKFAVIDGPRDDASLASSAKVVTGSANWSSTGGTVYDENTFFIENSAEIAATYQNEFDALWKGSRDFTGPATAQPLSTANISPAQVADEPGLEVLLTRGNMTPGGTDGTTWKTNNESLKVSDQFVAAIERAQTSIHISSAHIRLKPVADALIEKHQANPNFDIKVYLDQQEWISTSGNTQQKQDVADCIARSTTAAQKRDCEYNDFLFSKNLVDAGIAVRFKSYSYRWNATYAVQMHSKYMIVDGKEVLSGSYNLSMNSEHDTFENALHLSGPQFAAQAAAFEGNFAKLWDTARNDGSLTRLRTAISNDATIPLTFNPIALTWSELDSLRVLIRQNCTLADSPDFRSNPGAHKTCAR